MWPKNACVIRKMAVSNADVLRGDPEVAAFLEAAPGRLGKRGRFILRLSGIPWENSVLAEGKSKKACEQCIDEFERLLIRRGYMQCEHRWEVIRETDFGEMDYSSYGGGVEHFIVTLFRCRLCGALRVKPTKKKRKGKVHGFQEIRRQVCRKT